MDYTLITLSALGLFGILIHNLVKLNSINRKSQGEINIFKYWKIERFSILLSVCFVTVCLMVRTEISQLERVGNWLGLAFVAIGYMAQSIVVSFSRKADKYLESITGGNDEDKVDISKFPPTSNVPKSEDK